MTNRNRRHEETLTEQLRAAEREVARLRIDLARAQERERTATEAYEQQQQSYRELEALYQAMTERAQKAESELDAYRRAAATLRDAWDHYSVCADDFGALGALDACIEQQEALDRAIAGVIEIENTREER